jgi:hypothetical protein
LTDALLSFAFVKGLLNYDFDLAASNCRSVPLATLSLGRVTACNSAR